MIISDINMEENIWITIVTIFLTLSLISERISNLIKLHIPSLRKSSKDEEEEKKRERNVMWLAVSSGWLVAIIAGANFFELLELGELSSVHIVSDCSLWGFTKHISGFLLSGLFISLGSKFWHDVLDIVLQFSKLKKVKKLSEEENLKKNQFSYFEIKEKEQRLEHLVRNNLEKLRSIPNYRGYIIENIENDFIVKFKFLEKIPDKNEIAWIGDFLSPEEYQNIIYFKTEIDGS